MHELLLLRHAEARQAEPGGDDAGRPLSDRGEAQARAVGEWLAGQGATPDVMLSSPARRARMTAAAVCEALGAGTPQLLPAIYQATPGELLALLENHASEARCALLIGHNPGLERLLALLTKGQPRGATDMRVATLAWIAFADARVEPGRGRLDRIWSP